jgi:hypothetical protein
MFKPNRVLARSAFATNNCLKLLQQFRVCAPTFPTFDLARLRAETWSKLGQPLIASVFNEFCRIALPATSHSPRSDGSTGG